MNRNVAVRIFANAPLLILGITAASSAYINRESHASQNDKQSIVAKSFFESLPKDQYNEFIRDYTTKDSNESNNNPSEDTIVLQAVKFYTEKSELSQNKELSRRYLVLAGTIARRLSAPEGRMIAQERIQKARAHVKLLSGNQGPVFKNVHPAIPDLERL